MTLLKLIIVIIASIVYFEIFGQHYDFVKVLPGQGIVFNSDSILLNQSTIKEVHRILNIKDKSNPDEFTITMWDGYDPETYEETSGIEYTKEIKYKTITFEFADDTDKHNLKLRWIRIKDDKSFKIYTDSGLMVGMINPRLEEIFQSTGKKDYISENGLTYNFYTYGISLQLEKLENNDLRIIEISTHFKLE